MIKDTLHVILHEAAKPATSSWIYMVWIVGIALLVLLILLNWHKLKRILSFIRLKEYKLSIAGIELAGTLEYNAAAQEAAWRIYIELATRVSGNELRTDTGILREALTSLYSAFGTLRETLKLGGSELAKPPSKENIWTVATLSLQIMNNHMRPFLSKWHPLLQEYEKTKAEGVAQYTHEQKWPENAAFREHLRALIVELQGYVAVLKGIAEGKTE